MVPRGNVTSLEDTEIVIVDMGKGQDYFLRVYHVKSSSFFVLLPFEMGTASNSLRNAGTVPQLVLTWQPKCEACALFFYTSFHMPEICGLHTDT